MNVMYRLAGKPLLAKSYDFNYLNELIFITSRHFKTTEHVLSEKKFNIDHSKIVKRDGTVIKKKTEKDKLITLVYNSREKVLTMTDALKLAEHKGLSLIKIPKPSQKSMDFYQLSNASSFSPPKLNSDNVNGKKVNVKRYIFKANIADFDLLNKVKGLSKALNKYKIASYTTECPKMDPAKSEELSGKIQKALRDEGINFEITSVRGTHAQKTFMVKAKEEDVPCVNNVEDSQKSEEPLPKK